MNLPLEIITDILLRLPAKTLLRFKIVCKLWYNSIKDSNFGKIHLERSLAMKTNLHFVFRTPVLHLADFDTFENPIKLNYPYKNLLVRIKGSCRGLLCLRPCGFQHRLFIYNPTTQTYKGLPLLESTRPIPNATRVVDYGFGYDSVSDDYKCVRVLVDLTCFKSEVMVYSLKDDVWRTAPSFPYNDSYFQGNVYLNDIIHWVCYEAREGGLPLPIVTFDLRNESFSTLPLPNLVIADVRCMDVGILDGCLCLSASYYTYCHVWLMKDYGVAGSWTLLYSLPNNSNICVNPARPLCYSMNFNKLFVDFPFFKVASINLETMVVTDVEVADFDECTDAHLCVENLLMLEGHNNP